MQAGAIRPFACVAVTARPCAVGGQGFAVGLEGFGQGEVPVFVHELADGAERVGEEVFGVGDVLLGKAISLGRGVSEICSMTDCVGEAGGVVPFTEVLHPANIPARMRHKMKFFIMRFSLSNVLKNPVSINYL